MDKETILTIVRQILLAVGAGFVTNGTLDNETLQAIAGGFVALAAVVWGLVSKKRLVSDKKDLEAQVVATGQTPVTDLKR